MYGVFIKVNHVLQIHQKALVGKGKAIRLIDNRIPFLRLFICLVITVFGSDNRAVLEVFYVENILCLYSKDFIAAFQNNLFTDLLIVTDGLYKILCKPFLVNRFGKIPENLNPHSAVKIIRE